MALRLALVFCLLLSGCATRQDDCDGGDAPQTGPHRVVVQATRDAGPATCLRIAFDGTEVAVVALDAPESGLHATPRDVATLSWPHQAVHVQARTGDGLREERTMTLGPETYVIVRVGADRIALEQSATRPAWA